MKSPPQLDVTNSAAESALSGTMWQSHSGRDEPSAQLVVQDNKKTQIVDGLNTTADRAERSYLQMALGKSGHLE